MAKTNRICHSCSSSYYYCPSCPDEKRDPQIYIMWCGERCRDIFQLLTDETFKKITTVECKEQLIKMGVTENDNFRDSVKAHVTRVLNYSEPIEEIVEEINTEELPIVEQIQVVNKVKPTTNENVVQAQMYAKKKKRRNSEVD